MSVERRYESAAGGRTHVDARPVQPRVGQPEVPDRKQVAIRNADAVAQSVCAIVPIEPLV